MNGREIKEVSVKTAKFIFEQSKKSGVIPKDEVFDRGIVEV